MKNKNKIIAAATISSVFLTGCGTVTPTSTTGNEIEPLVTVDPLPPEPTDIPYDVVGNMIAPTPNPDDIILMGDYAAIPDEEDESFVTVDPIEFEDPIDDVLMGVAPVEE